MAFKIVLRINCLRIELNCMFLIWCVRSDQALHACPSRISDEEVVRDPLEFETREDEAGPSTAGASSSRPCKLQVRRPRASSPVGTETSGSDEDSFGLGEVHDYHPPRRARTASKLAELGQVRLSLCILISY